MTVPLVRWPTDPAEAGASGCGIMVKITRDAGAAIARIVSLV